MKRHQAAFLLILLFLLSAASAGEQRAVVIEGRVLDKETRDPLPAFVRTEDGVGCSADIDGRFRLTVKPTQPGGIKLDVWLIGYKKKSVEAEPGRFLTIELEIEPLSIQEISVTADSVVSDEKSQKTVTLNKMEVYTLPGTAADPLYASHVLPGVNSLPDSSSLLVRGGAPDEVGYYLDGIEIGHPFLSESLHESYFSIFDNQVIENFSVSTSGFHPKYGPALSGIMDINAKDLAAEGEGGLGISIMGLNSYLALPLKKWGGLVASMNRGFSDILTALNNGDGQREFRTDQAFGKFILRIDKANYLRVYGLDDGYRYAQEGTEKFSADSRNLMGALSWTFAPAQNFAAKALISGYRHDLAFDKPEILHFKSRDEVLQERLDILWDFGRHFLEFGAHARQQSLATELRERDARSDQVQGNRLGFYANDKLRISDRLFMNLGGQVQSLDLLGNRFYFHPRLSLAYVLTKREILRVSAGSYGQFGDSFILKTNPGLSPKKAVHFSLSYDRIQDDLELRATLYDKEYANLYLQDADGSASSRGRGYARGAEFFLKKKNKNTDAVFVYNYLSSRRRENEALTLSPSPYEIVHSATAILSWKFRSWSLGARISYATGRPFTPLQGREWNPESESYIPLWGAPYSGRYPHYQRLDVNGNKRLNILRKMAVVYFGITNVLNDKNILRYEYGDDYAGRKDQQSIFGRTFFIGIYIPFF